jgi:hypothetical protein
MWDKGGLGRWVASSFFGVLSEGSLKGGFVAFALAACDGIRVLATLE